MIKKVILYVLRSDSHQNHIKSHPLNSVGPKIPGGSFRERLDRGTNKVIQIF